jgi:hypothetical protein
MLFSCSCQLRARSCPAEIVQVAGYLGVAPVDRPGVVASDDADVGVPEPAGGDQDAVRVGDPTGVGGPEIVRGHVGESGGADRLKEPAAEAVVALLPMGGVSLAAGKRERVRVIGQRGEVLLDELHDLARGSARRHLAECNSSIRVN